VSYLQCRGASAVPEDVCYPCTIWKDIFSENAKVKARALAKLKKN
jgi:hypothetical protein